MSARRPKSGQRLPATRRGWCVRAELRPLAGRTRLPAGGSHAAGDHPVRDYGPRLALHGRHLGRFHHYRRGRARPGHSRLHWNSSLHQLRFPGYASRKRRLRRLERKGDRRRRRLIFRTDGSDTLTATDTSDSSITSTVIVPVSPPSTVTAAVQGNTLYVLGDASTDSVSLSLTANHTQLQVLNNGIAVAGSPFAISSFSTVDVIDDHGQLFAGGRHRPRLAE